MADPCSDSATSERVMGVSDFEALVARLGPVSGTTRTLETIQDWTDRFQAMAVALFALAGTKVQEEATYRGRVADARNELVSQIKACQSSSGDGPMLAFYGSARAGMLQHAAAGLGAALEAGDVAPARSACQNASEHLARCAEMLSRSAASLRD